VGYSPDDVLIDAGRLAVRDRYGRDPREDEDFAIASDATSPGDEDLFDPVWGSTPRMVAVPDGRRTGATGSDLNSDRDTSSLASTNH
jgi:hypothetical protein